MAQKVLRQSRSRRGSLSCCVLVACAFLTTPPLVCAEILQSLHYGYDDAGNVTRIGDQITLPNTQTLTYDDLDRMLAANGPYGTGGANSTFTYAYNEIGNMTMNPQVGAYTYPPSGPTTVRPHAATVAGPYPITYDNNGNVLTMTDPTGFFGYNATYNTDNRLSSVTTTFASVPTTSTFVYDGDGGRVKKTVGTTTTRYISKLYECETTGGSTTCTQFIWAGDQQVATVSSGGTIHYWHSDHLGSTNMITNSSGARVQTLAYYPYGDVRVNQSSATPAVDVHYKYTGKELDASSNLYFYEFRYYHAVFGRFVSPDSIVPNLTDPQDLNRYAYARNNPMQYTDPSGHFPILVAIGIGIAVGAISAGIQSDWDLEATLIGGFIGGASAGVGTGVASSVYNATLSALGGTWASVAGGVVGGAVAGGTSAVLANAAGYRVNIGLAIASGAAAGGIAGGGYGLGNQLGALAAAPLAGASAAAISGTDPGTGALIAAATAAFSLGLKVSYEIAQNWDMIMADLGARQRAAILHGFVDDRVEVSALSGKPISTTRGMTRGLIPGSTSIDRGVAVPGGHSSLFHTVESINSIVEGAGAITIAIHGYGQANVQMRLLLGGIGGMEGMAIRGALVVNGVSGLGLAFGGGYMIGTGINQLLPPAAHDTIGLYLNKAYQHLSP